MTRETWLEDLAHELATLGVGQERVASIVVEADGHLAESSQAPLEVFGSPARYAQALAAALEHQRPGRRAGAVRVRARGVRKRNRLRIADPASALAHVLPFWSTREFGTYAIDGDAAVLAGVVHAAAVLAVAGAVISARSARSR